MALLNPAEYGATFPPQLDPGIAPEVVAAFAADQSVAAAEGSVICDDGLRLFGLAAGEAVVHQVTGTRPTGYVAPKLVGWIDV